jgi:hypothetical protein
MQKKLPPIGETIKNLKGIKKRGFNMTKRKSYKQSLYRDLQDPEIASTYLEEALKDEDIHVFLLALQDVAEANGGIREVADKERSLPTRICSNLTHIPMFFLSPIGSASDNYQRWLVINSLALQEKLSLTPLI